MRLTSHGLFFMTSNEFIYIWFFEYKKSNNSPNNKHFSDEKEKIGIKTKKAVLKTILENSWFFRDKRPIFRFNAKNGRTTNANIYICNIEINTVDQRQLLAVFRHYPMCVKVTK